MARARAWALRCVHESSLHERSAFVTLTYDQAHVPKDGSLDVSHWQKFAKRLRKAVGPFRFFHCGEYGEVGLRPHYHALLFGVDFSGDRVLVDDRPGHRLWRSPMLSEVWGLGYTTVGSVTVQSAAYVARYCVKKARHDSSRYQRVDPNTAEVYSVLPEYVTMSRRPGIGSGWLDKFRGDVYPSDEVIHQGRRYRPPRFYDERLPEEELVSVRARRMARVLARKEELTPERLEVRERLAVAALERFRRS